MSPVSSSDIILNKRKNKLLKKLGYHVFIESKIVSYLYNIDFFYLFAFLVVVALIVFNVYFNFWFITNFL